MSEKTLNKNYADAIEQIARENRVDAAETFAFSRQLEAVETTVLRRKYAQMKGREFVPVDTSDGNAVSQTTYRMWDAYGSAKVISDWSTDFPTVQLSAQEFSAKYKSIGAGYEYTVQQMREAARANIPLETELATGARDMIERRIDEAVAVGVPEAKMPGLLNHPNVPIVNFPTGNWASATGDQILADLNFARNYASNNTSDILESDTMLLDSPSYNLLAAKPLNTANGAGSVLSAFLAQNPGFTVAKWNWLNTADAAGTGPRVVVYKRDEEYLKFKLGQPFETFPAQVHGLSIKVPCHARFAGVSIRHPLSLLYLENHA